MSIALQKINFLFLIPTLLLLNGCGNKKPSNPKVQSIKKNLKNKKSQTAITDLPLLTESNITYNYTSEDFLDENLFQNLILSDNKSYQLNPTNGSRLPEQEILELEKLALAWNQKEANIDKTLKLLHEKEFVDATEKKLELVYFDPKNSKIDAKERENIEHKFKAIEATLKNSKKLLVRGHCDASESESEIFRLSFERAKAVKDELVKMGLEPNKISIVAVGAGEPIIPAEYQSPDKNKENALKALNCRAEIILA